MGFSSDQCVEIHRQRDRPGETLDLEVGQDRDSGGVEGAEDLVPAEPSLPVAPLATTHTGEYGAEASLACELGFENGSEAKLDISEVKEDYP